MWIALLSAALMRGSETTLTVLSAASLKAPLKEIIRLFEAKESGTHIEASFAGSQELAAQINLGAPADAFLSADRAQMDVVVKSRKVRVADVQPFAHNALCVLVAKKASSQLVDLRDLGKPNFKICIAREKVPVGAYTQQMVTTAARTLGAKWRAGFNRNIVSKESNVSAVVARVELGEADAGIVYRTDALRASNSVLRAIPTAWNVRATYYLAPLAISHDPTAAKRFTNFVRSKGGQAIFRKYGFQTIG